MKLQVAESCSDAAANWSACRKMLPAFGLQQAVTAALALLCNIQTSYNAAERADDLQRLSALLEKLQGMSSIHTWAKAVYNTVKAEMEQLRTDNHDLQTPPYTPGDFMTSLQHPNIEFPDSAPTAKRRRLSGHEAHSRSSSEPILVPDPHSSAPKSVSP